MADSNNNSDTLHRPSYMTKHASLLNYGSDLDPILIWADYIGVLYKNGKKYPHIHGIQYFYVKAEKRDTIYYENMELRNKNKKFDFGNCKILNYPGDATVKVSNINDSLIMFAVLESNQFNREHKGFEFKRMPTINLENDGYLSDVDIEFDLLKVNQGKFELILNDMSRLNYKSCLNCDITNLQISFLSRENGRIYLITQGEYLELENEDDAKIFKKSR